MTAQRIRSQGKDAESSAGQGTANPSNADESRAWTRREVIGAGLAMLGGAALLPWLWPEARAARGSVSRHPLRIPSMVVPVGLTLNCVPTRIDLGGGQLSNVLAYNGQFPGPTLVARTGDMTSITLSNGLAEETIAHWHGMVVSATNDGGPRLAIPPGRTYGYGFPIVQRAALNWYHPHPHGMTGRQVNLGLAGAFIVRDNEEDALRLPAGAYEVPLIIRDASVDKNGNLTYNPTASGFSGKFSLVNGIRSPYLTVNRGVYRFRVLNGANARVFRLALSSGAAFTVIGNDGGLLAAPASATAIELGMGERLDLLVNFSGLSQGDTVMLRCLDAGWDLLQFVGSGNAGVSYQAPAQLSTISALTGPSPPTRTFYFDGMSRINGQVYDLNRIDFQVPFGVTERWRFTTGGNAPHPVHVHGASFQVVARSGGRGMVYPWERGWKDTVLLNDRETVDVLIRFDRYRGLYLLHCHQLEHEDAGMMANFQVV